MSFRIPANSIFSALLLLALALNVHAQQLDTLAGQPGTLAGQPGTLAGQQIDSSMDWESGAFSLTIVEERTKRQYNRPASFYTTELDIQETARSILFDSLLDIQVDSNFTLGDRARRDISVLGTVDMLIASAATRDITPGNELETIQSRFELNIYPALTQELVRHSNPFPMEEVLEWYPRSQYSGVVIYAQRSLAVHGEDSTAILKPALFPVIYDENMRLIVDRNRMKPAYVERWGGASYSSNFTENRERIGSNPLRILAVGVFGITQTDPLISLSDANILLHSASNRNLLQEGRILIIIDDGVN